MVEKNATHPAPGNVPATPQASGAKPSTRERLERENKEKIEGFKQRDALLRARATGAMTEETRDKVLALGGDVTRASPDPAQVLPDAVPGLTTTTGAYRTPIDPTTAAVPAPEDSELVQRMQGAPTMGSSGHGQPEELWAEPKERPLIVDDEGKPQSKDSKKQNEKHPADHA